MALQLVIVVGLLAGWLAGADGGAQHSTLPGAVIYNLNEAEQHRGWSRHRSACRCSANGASGRDSDCDGDGDSSD
jgi:hypothetical protein